MYTLLIDDFRDVPCDAIARTGEIGVELLTMNCWDMLCIDHDLGAGISGYAVIVQMLERDDIRKPERVQIVSSNPVGRENIANALIAHGYTRKNPVDFVLTV